MAASLLGNTAMDMAIVGGGAAAGSALTFILASRGYLPLPGALSLPIGAALGGGVAHALYDAIDSSRSFQLKWEGKTALLSGGAAFAVASSGLLPSAGLGGAATVGFVSGAVAGWFST